MKINKTYSAFTVIEMLFTIAITSVVISVVYVIYANFSKQVYSYFYESTHANEVYSFYQQMKLDAFYANAMLYENQEIVFDYYNGINIHYKKKGDTIFRFRQNKKETGIYIHNLKIYKPKVKLLNKKLVDQISFESRIYEKPIRFSVFKNYPLTHKYYGYRLK